ELAGPSRGVAPGAVREDRERQRVELDAEACSGGERLVTADEDRIVDAHLVDERPGLVERVHGDADDGQAGIRVLELEQHRNFLPARRTPGRPEVDEKRAAGPVSDRLQLAVEVREGELGQL